MACTPGMIQVVFEPQTPWSERAVGPQGPILRPHGTVRTRGLCRALGLGRCP